MKNCFRLSPLALRRLWFTAGFALFLAGCATNKEVRKIVQDSNYELLVAEAGSAAEAAPANGHTTTASPAALARLEAFVQQHPDNPAMLNPLRLRRALLHLNNRSLALAQAAFAEIDPHQLHTARDQGLYAAHSTMLWWWQYSQLDAPGEFVAQHRAEAETALRELQRVATETSAPADLRDYLLELRAWIGLKLGLDLADPTESRRIITEAVDVFTSHLSAAENTQLASGRLATNATAFDPSTRRILRTQSLLDYLAAKIGQRPAAAQPEFHSPGCRAYYASLRSAS